MVGRGLEAPEQELERARALRREKNREHRRPKNQGGKNDEAGQSVRLLLLLASDGKSAARFAAAKAVHAERIALPRMIHSI